MYNMIYIKLKTHTHPNLCMYIYIQESIWRNTHQKLKESYQREGKAYERRACPPFKQLKMY